MRPVFAIFFVVMVLLLAASFAGGLHPVGDSIAVFRFWIAVGVMGSAALVIRGKLRLAALVCVLGAFAVPPLAIKATLARADGPFDFTLYQKNMLFQNPILSTLEQDIRDLEPDFIVLQEVSRANLGAVQRLARDYRTTEHCARRRTSSLVVLSRFPRTDAPVLCPDTNGVLGVQVMTPKGPLWVINIHLRWPWPYSQPKNLVEIVPLLQGIDGRAVVAGDFNAVAWSHAVRQIAKATGTQRMGPIYKTYLGRNLFLQVPIDHVLAPGPQGRLTTRPLLGSDHLGLLAEFTY